MFGYSGFQKVKWYLEGNFYYFFRTFFPSKRKMAMDKAKLVERKSPFCLTQKSCINCGCKIPQVFYSSKPCENGCYD